jgi:hypothetical protein
MTKCGNEEGGRGIRVASSEVEVLDGKAQSRSARTHQGRYR